MTQGMVAVWCPQCRETHIQGVPQAWVFYNRHYHPSGNCVGSLVDVPHLENAMSLIREGFPFTDAADLDRRLSTSKKNLTWMGNLSGTLSNAYAFDSGPFAGEGLMVQSGRVVREPEGHVHKHYLLRREHLSPGARFEEERLVFQRAHSEIYQAFANLHSLFNAAWLYPFSLFKKGFSIHSLRPEDIDHMWRLDAMEDPAFNPHSLLMLLYAEDVHTAVRRGLIKPADASVIIYEDPLMLRLDTPKIALDCATLCIGTWNAQGWKEIADLSEFEWPARAEAFTRYFHRALSSNSIDLKSITRRWIGL
jgi:hypothetical protein